ncbi:MAG: AmmeMemoRadiSam system protein B [Deltaproteobacteria bacterium RBG_16_48_10]|nr:MAG: AmmeMemoRadiSam system protein B [Deltaproteobacteria bacterium RBG_16_48_10]
MDYPKLRSINAFPVERSGQTLVYLQDPQNVSLKALFLPPQTYYVLTLFDGQHSLLDIQAEYMRQFGDFLFTEKLQEIIDQLDENLYLEGERFEKALREIEDRFKKAPVREAAFAGKSYQTHPEGVRIQLEGYFKGPDGPGPLGERAVTSGLKGVIVPHIDFQRGGFCYAFAHREIWEKNTAHSFIIFGIAHTGMEHPFSLTRKDFLTPLGKLEVDQELVDAIQSRCPYDLFHDEGIHRSEHSVEFQTLFLRFLYPEPAPLKIVPILCGSFQEPLERGVSPMELKPYRHFKEALAESVSERGEEVCYIASADLAHMGLQFGDRKGMEEYDLRVLEETDLEMLGYTEKMEEEGFYSSILRERDQRKICGLPAIYTLLKVMEAQEGRLLKYGQAFTPETQSVVSYASLAFY